MTNKTPNYVKNQTANASDGTADHAVPGPSVLRDGSSSSRVDTILSTDRTDPDQQHSFRPSTGAIVNPESTIPDNTTVSYSGVNTPGGLPTQPFQSGLTSSGHTSQNAQQQGPKNIWIIGSAIVHWARRTAFTRPGGQQLTLQNTGCNVFWLGQRGMTWDCLNRVVDKNVSELRLAKLIVIQLGSNDLGIKKTYELYSDIKLGLLRLKVMCPNARIVWSEILMRRYWYSAQDGRALEKSRKRLNLLVRNFMQPPY